MVFFQSIVPPSDHEREQMLVFFAVVVVNVRRANAVLHDIELLLHAFSMMRVARIEHKVQIQMRHVAETAADARPSKARSEYSPAGSPRRAAAQTGSILRAR